MVFLFAPCGPSSFFLLFCFEFVFFCFFIPLKKMTPKKPGHSKKTQKCKNAEKTDKKKSVSAVVFTNSVLKFFGVGLKVSFLG